jgi:hypothetical protein
MGTGLRNSLGKRTDEIPFFYLLVGDPCMNHGSFRLPVMVKTFVKRKKTEWRRFRPWDDPIILRLYQPVQLCRLAFKSGELLFGRRHCSR